MLLTKSLYIKLIAVLLACCSFVVFGQTANDMRRPQTVSEMKRDQMTKKQTLGQVESNSYRELQREIPLFQLIRQKSSGVVNAEFKEVQRKRLRGINTDKLDMSKQVSEVDMKDGTDKERAVVPELSSLRGNSTFEFYDIPTGRTFQMTASKAEMAEFARSMSRNPDESMPLDKPDRRAVAQDEQTNKSWSNADDSRTRRAIADGYSDTHSIYQRIANYGGCSANVISANSTRLIATTAGHCVFASTDTFNYSTVDPRRNGGASSTWGTWTPVGFGYVTAYRDLNCEMSFGWDCIPNDIALVVAVPNAGATPPSTMGWGYRSKSWLEKSKKYRRGYPGCGYAHSPAVGCTTDNLYGDGPYTIGPLDYPVDGWNRMMSVSSDMNPGDSGSGSYYYRGGYPYVFAVTSAELTCGATCTDDYPNFLRRITPDWFDFMSDVVF